MFPYDHFGVDFEIETRIELCGIVHELVGTVYLTCRWNGNWRLDTIDGVLIEDPDGDPKEFNLLDNPHTSAAIKKWLLNDQAFRDRADDNVMYHD